MAIRAIASLCKAFDVHPSTVRDEQSIGTDGKSRELNPIVRGVALDQNQARLAILQVPDQAGRAAKIFQHLADKNISVDMIIQSQRCHIVGDCPRRDIAFTIAQTDVAAAEALLKPLLATLDCGSLAVDPAIAKVSIVGSGMIGQPGVAAKMFASLAQNGINIETIATSEIKISCVIPEADGIKALKAIHKAFELGTPQTA